jgi:uncharacterized protein YkwD
MTSLYDYLLRNPNVSFVHELVNIERRNNDVHTLLLNIRTCEVARKYADRLSQFNCIQHNDPETMASVRERLIEDGIVGLSCGENLALCPPEHCVSLWMSSDGHRENLINYHFTLEGLGFSFIGNGQYICCQVLLSGDLSSSVDTNADYYIEYMQSKNAALPQRKSRFERIDA